MYICRLLLPELPLESCAETVIANIPTQNVDKEEKYTVISDRLSCSSALSSSSSAGSWRTPAGHQYKRPLGDLFIRHVFDQDGVRQTLRGKDADASLYSAVARLDHYDSSGEEELEEDVREDQQKRRQRSTMPCGYAIDGSIRRLPKRQLRYSRESLKAMLNKMIVPRSTVPLPSSEDS